jgi:Tfp pilus assembly protein PilF
MADTYHCLGKLSLAEEYYERAAEVDPDDANARENLSRWRKIKEDLAGQ